MRVIEAVEGRRVLFRNLRVVGGVLVVATLLALSVFFYSIVAHAEEVDGPWTYEEVDGTAVLVGYDFDIGGADVDIPASLGGLPVTEVPDSLFEDSTEITSVTIPGSVKSIGDSAFSDANNLTTVNLGHGVESIGTSAFAGSGITEINIPNSVTYIGHVAFSYTNIDSVVIPDSVIEMGFSPFQYSTIEILQIGTSSFSGEPLLDVGSVSGLPQLKHLSFGNNVIAIGTGGGVNDTPLLETIDFGSSVQSLVNVNPNSSHLKLIEIPDSVTTITSSSFSNSELNITDITIPDSVTLISHSFSELSATNVHIGTSDFSGEPTMVIGTSSFNNVTIENLVFGDSVKSIGNGAFGGGGTHTHIESIDFGESLQTVGTAFRNVSGLSELVLPNSLLSISAAAFSNNEDLETLLIGSLDYQGEARMVIDGSAFERNPQLKEVTIGNSVKEISGAAFGYLSALETLVIGSDEYTGEPELDIYYSFVDASSLTTLLLGNNIRSIVGGTFNNATSLETLQIPDSVEEIAHVFNGATNLVTIIFGTPGYTGESKMTVAGEFSGLSSLSDLHFNNAVKQITNSAFNGNTNVGYIFISSAVETINNGSLNGLSGLESLEVGTVGYSGPAKLAISDSLIGLSSLTSLVIRDSVKSITSSFNDLSSLESLNLPDSIESILNSFNRATILHTVAIGSPGYTGPAKLIIEGAAFTGLTALRNVELNNSVKAMRQGVFSGTLITSLNLPNSLEYIGAGAFSSSLQLESLTVGTPEYDGIPILEIDSGSFFGTRIKSLSMYGNVKSVGSGAFSGNLLTSLIIPDSVEFISGGSFESETLRSVTLGSGLTSIAYAFSGAPIEEIVVRGTNLTIEDISMGVWSSHAPRYIKVYTDDPTNPAGLSDLVVRETSDINNNGYLDIQNIFLINPSQVIVEHRDADSYKLLAGTQVSLGDADSYEIIDLNDDSVDGFYRAGMAVSYSALNIDGYIKPADKTVVLEPGLNTVVFKYSRYTPQENPVITIGNNNQNTAGNTINSNGADEHNSDNDRSGTNESDDIHKGGESMKQAVDDDNSSNDASGVGEVVLGVIISTGVIVTSLSVWLLVVRPRAP